MTEPRLERWWVRPCGPDRFILCGAIFDDQRGRFPDGRIIQTSLVIEMNQQEGWAQTMNTRYRLGGAGNFVDASRSMH